MGEDRLWFQKVNPNFPERTRCREKLSPKRLTLPKTAWNDAVAELSDQADVASCWTRVPVGRASNAVFRAAGQTPRRLWGDDSPACSGRFRR